MDRLLMNCKKRVGDYNCIKLLITIKWLIHIGKVGISRDKIKEIENINSPESKI